jgi:signal transduction histidine kinase
MRLRIALALGALSLLVILAQSLTMLAVFDQTEEEFIDQMLTQQIAHSMAVWKTAPESAFPNTPAMQLYRFGPGMAPSDGLPAEVLSLPVGNHEIRLGGREAHVAVRHDGSARYILVYDAEEHEGRMLSLMLLTITASTLLALVVLLSGYALAGRLSGSLERLAARVDTPDGAPLAGPDMERELRAIAEALDRHRQRQQEALDRERAFAANLSHELRTPLTAIRTDAELLAALPDAPQAVRRRANRMIQGVDRINALGSSLLLLSREAGPALLEEIRLQPAVREVWEPLSQSASKPVSLRVMVPEGTTVSADPTLFDLVLRNLLDNALRHSDRGEIVCALEGSRLIVSDCGRGFAEAELPHVFDRFFSGPQGRHGLGLALVQHVCRASGWRVSAGNAATGGGQVTIDLGDSLLPS